MSQPLPLQPPTPAPTTPPKKGNGLAITAVVFGSLFFVPFASLIGLILGIVALATGRSKTLSIVAICLSAFFSFFIGIYAAIAIPAFMKYVRRSKAVEATTNTRVLVSHVGALSPEERAKLPDSDWTPREGACGYPTSKHPADPAAWNVEPWKTLVFSVDDPSYYQYRVRHDGDGFIVEAQGDLDCDGIFSHFVRHVGPDGMGGELETENEIE